MRAGAQQWAVLLLGWPFKGALVLSNSYSRHLFSEMRLDQISI